MDHEDMVGIHSFENVSSNKKTLLYLLDSTSLVFGIGAGILQLESIYGFLMFFCCYFVVSTIFIAYICKFKPSKYYVNPIQEIYFDSLFRELAGFVMAWTFSYAFVG
ncbi:hypothetical protein Kpol_478p13 [Vanderwaltozyma polyspora DSM 70294]|uniref:ER membrane protein complex subunit 6 n=1 Tax=Vanderwaltozyma polyspora (strain ATCC 22028 / DSM 70294 / BCRC 21397 / CBS 2163 / NBRC 10782 / NRRL Y-8283 / UCD 57-17) TaxID=436907 RepID=A7TPN2_VANPO|nr:uncharacterized protein Kpol_478p13 [Vanderwaltozyma polyspora DSM 70294]EDO15777.1 hypothetical protein Kpol_478p13 [Vanderwaltozyma polyspora DSM 70294]